NEAQSHLLQSMIPLDRDRVLDLGCGAGYWTARIADHYPWMRVVGFDAGRDFIGRAIELYSNARISFERGDFLALPFADAEYVRAWKRAADATQAERADEAMGWVYAHLSPERSSATNDAVEVLAGGFAFCAGYAVSIGELLRREGVDVAWVTMEAEGHPRGRG